MIVPPPTPKSPLKAPAAVPIAASFKIRGRDMAWSDSGIVRDTRAALGARDTDTDTQEGAPQLLDQLRAHPDRAALLIDVDGTLAPIAATPEQASVPDSTRELLTKRAPRFGLVACISGRRATDARSLVGIDSIAYSGNHGIEYLEPGAAVATVDARVAELSERVRAFALQQHSEALQAAGVRLEDKQSICAFHWRGARDAFGARALLEQVAVNAREQGLTVHWGRKVLEIRPDVDLDKGVAVAAVLERASVELALYAGDDATDLDAFAKLRELQDSGRLKGALCVGVMSAEGPRQIGELADLTVVGPDGLVELLASLAD